MHVQCRCAFHSEFSPYLCLWDLREKDRISVVLGSLRWSAGEGPVSCISLEFVVVNYVTCMSLLHALQS